MTDSTTNHPIKTALPDNITKLLREAESTLHHSLKDDIEAAYKGADGTLDPVAATMIKHISCLQSDFFAVEYLLKTPPLKRLAGDVLYGMLMLNLSFSKLCNAANEAQGIALDRPLYRYEDGGAILEAINAARVLNDVIADLREAV